jgi:hypothetical protein
MGVIIERFCPKREPAKDIAIHFCKENFIKKPFNQPNAFEINSLKKYIFLDSFDVNSWVKIKSGGVKLKPKEVLSPVVIAHQDINTFTELMDIKTYNDNDIVKFFSNISDEFDSILKLYFPKS